MTLHEFRHLHEGDMVQSRLTGLVYQVTGNYGTHVTAVQTADITHLDEWDLVVKAQLIRMPQRAKRRTTTARQP